MKTSKTSRREAINARDEAVVRVGRTTRWIGTAAVAGTLFAGAGFAHLIPTHLPRLNEGDSSSNSSSNSSSSDSSSSSSGSSSSSSNGGLQPPNNPPGNSSGPSQVTSGGS